MAVDLKQFSGIMNTDDSESVMPKTHHKMGRNIRFRGNGNNFRCESVNGNTIVTNPYLPAGNNECKGAFFDELGKRIFSFNYNSNGYHAIYQYDLSTSLWSRVALVGYNTDGDILGFTLSGSIYAVKMLYGDTTQGDTLYFNNCQKEPCQINIKMALAGTYGTIKRTYLNVIKAIPTIPPIVTYENDAAVSVNNLRKKLFKFKIRYVYSNKDKSLWSSHGVLPLPVNYLDTAIDKDPTKNCRVGMIIPTGDSDVSKIEIAAATSSGKAFSDYFLIKVIDKVADSVSSNDITTFRFYNNQAYVPIDVDESIQLFDLVPLQANALEMLNGNVPIYGGILEGYNRNAVTGTATSTYETQQTTQPKFVFTSNQSGDSGFGTGNIHSVLLGAITVGDIFNIYTTNQTITFTATVATTANVITGLAAAAVTAGFTVVSSDTENLTIIKTGEVLLRSASTPLLMAVTDSFVYDINSRYNYVIVYFDKAGRSIGSETCDGFNVQTINYTETTGARNIPKIQFSITSRPPLHAYYYQIGRTKNLTKLRKLEWVTDRTYKDKEFAYISIENLNTFILNNPSAKHLQYDFSANDRVRFMKVLSGTVNTIYTDKDFEIQSQVLSPNINGTDCIGQFLKISLPTTSGTFDFGTSDFYNYFIELYTPAQSVSEGLDLDYEFGERYTIGNPATATSFHQGKLQNQSTDLVTPATFEFTQGDFYYRSRTINTGAEYKYVVNADEEGIGRTTLGVTYVSETYTDANITPGSSPALSLAGFNIATNMDRYLLSIGASGAPYTFRIKGTIDVTFSDFAEVFSWYLEDSSGNVTQLIPPQAVKQGSSTFTFDTTFQLQNSTRVFIFAYSAGDFHNSKTYNQTDIKITRELPYTIGCIDPNFSDYFESAVNSNGRAWINDVNASQVFNPTLLRWGLAYQPNTNINQTNRFKPLNFDEIDRAKGQIQIFKVRDRILRVFQEKGCANVGIYAKFLQDSGNTNILTTTDDIVTKNNVQYYEGHYGLGNQPTSLVSGKNQDYFVDPIRGYQLRLSGDGLVPISNLYKGQFFIQPLFVPYNKDYLRTNGGLAKVLGYYNFAEEEYVTILQGGTLSGNTIEDYAFSFNEKRNAYSSFFDFHPEFILCAENVTYSWKNGQMYIHNNEQLKFYGTEYFPSIELVFNDRVAIKKTPLILSYQANTLWLAENDGDITTGFTNPQTGLQQISKLKSFNFDVQEGNYYAAFQRDINSRQNPLEGWHDGDYLKGTWLSIKLTSTSSLFSYIYIPYIKWAASPQNV